MSRHGRKQRQQQPGRQPRGSSRVMPASTAQATPSAEALASGRVVMLSNQPASRAVASYAGTAAALQAQQARQTGQLQQPGVMISPEKQYPAMPAISRKNPLLESVGAPGTAIFQGIITNDDYNPDFYWRDAVEIYDQMIRNDGQIMAIVQQLELPIRRATWTVEPFSASARDKEIASFIESCLFHDLVRTTADGRRVYQKWDDILRHCLMMLRYGFAAFEKVWREEDGWVKLAHLMPLLPMSVYRWWVGADNELVGVQQYTFKDYTYVFVDIPADKVLLFTHRMEGQNYQGFSLLRAAYKHWYYKDQFYKIDAIGLERNAIAVPFIELPPSFNSEDVSNAQTILANLRANESMGVTLPPGWKIGYLPGSEHYAGHALKSIEHHDVMIARSVLAQFINLGSTETGTYNLAVDQRQDLLESLQAEAEYIEDTFNADLIPQLCDFNFAQVEGYPRIKCSKLAQADITDLIDSIAKLKAKDANFLTPDPELEDWIRDQLGAPKATRSIIAGENPTAPTTPQRPDATPGQANDHSDAESTPTTGRKPPESNDGAPDVGGAADGGDPTGTTAPTKASDHAQQVVALTDADVSQHTGVMVALMLPPDVAQQIAWPNGEPADQLHITLAFLGDKSDLTPRQCETLMHVTRTYASQSSPLTARLAGLGSFPPSASSDGLRPVFAKAQIGGIQAWRAGLVKALKAAGLPVDETFKDYTPHITLAYVPDGADVKPPRPLPSMSFTLDTLTCAIGGEYTAYQMDNDPSEARQLAASMAESLAVIAGLDATERGQQAAEWLAGRSVTLFNPNHDGKGQFASGGGGGGAFGAPTSEGLKAAAHRFEQARTPREVRAASRDMAHEMDKHLAANALHPGVRRQAEIRLRTAELEKVARSKKSSPEDAAKARSEMNTLKRESEQLKRSMDTGEGIAGRQHGIPELPVRGKVRANETPEQALRRISKDHANLDAFDKAHADIANERPRDAEGYTKLGKTERGNALSRAIGRQRDTLGNEYAHAQQAHAAHLAQSQTPKGEALRQAYRDWASGRAYLDNRGSYHTYTVDAEGYKTGRAGVASWNKTVKGVFKSLGSDAHDNSAFHQAATAYAGQHPDEIKPVKGIMHYFAEMPGEVNVSTYAAQG